MLSVYMIRAQAIQDHYHRDNNKLRYINELRSLALDIRRKNPVDQLAELLRVVEGIEDRLTTSRLKFDMV